MPTEQLSEMRELAEGLDGEISSKLIEVADLTDRWFEDLESFDDESRARLALLEDEVLRWAVEACVPVEPVYGCTFSGGVENDPRALESRAATPEEAVAGLGPEGQEMIEMFRLEDGAAFAWIAENQVATQGVEVRVVDGAWAVSAIRTC